MNTAAPRLAWRRMLERASSSRAALVGLGALGAAAVLGVLTGTPVAPLFAPAAALCALQLCVALAVHRSLWRQPALLVFHLALLALAVLAALGRALSFEGLVELTEGVPLEAALVEGRAGAWHAGGTGSIAFVHDGFEIDYAPGLRRGATRNRVRWTDVHGDEQRAVIGDHHPLILDGWRFYTTPNKGYAPVLSWRPDGGATLTGAVHLPSFPMHALRQAREWPLPDGRIAWVMLDLDESPIDPRARSAFRLPGSHRLVLRMGELRAELAPGETVRVPGGALVYEELRTWMGYRVVHDPSLPWLLGLSLVAVCALAWHCARPAGGPRTLPVTARPRDGRPLRATGRGVPHG